MKRSQFLLLLLAIYLQSLAQVTIKKDVNKNTSAQPAVDKQVNASKIKPGLNYDFSNVRICVDKISNYDPGERPVKVYQKIPGINSNGQIVQSNTLQQGLSVYTK